MKKIFIPRPLAVYSSSPVRHALAQHRQVALGLFGLLCLGLAARLTAGEQPESHYVQTNLVADVSGWATATDPNLVNPWGLSRSATSPWWVADNGTGLSTLYTGVGAIVPLVVTVPNLPGVTDPSAPTGTVFNGTATDFLLAANTPARFLFATEGGTIAGWNSGTTAVQMVDKSATAVFKGLTLAQISGVNYLYAANFMAGTVDVFDRMFMPVTLSAWAFHDPHLPSGYAPFNVQNIGGDIYVSYAQKETGSIDEVHGAGKGYVDVYTSDGVLKKRMQHGSWFNAPWGLALAPADFGRFSNKLLVGQFGSGKIAAFDPASGRFLGFLQGEHHHSLAIDGLWALSFGNGANAGPLNSLYFTAGADDEAHGLFGTITAVADDDDHDCKGK
jgi:uncharacterized protein (TIGR03118 family)